MIQDMLIRYVITTQDKGSRQATAADRTIRTSIKETNRTLRESGQVATRVARESARAATTTTQGYTRRQKGARDTTRATRELAAATTQEVASAAKQAAASARSASAHSRQAAATSRAAQTTNSLATAEARAASAATRDAQAQTRLAAAYRRVTSAAGQAAATAATAAREQARSAATAARGAGASTGAAAAGGAALGRGRALAGGGALAAGLGFAQIVKAGVSFEKQMDRVQAVSQSSRKEMQRLNAQAIQLGQDTQFSAAEAAEGMYMLATQGFNAQQVMKTMPGTLDLAAASATDLGFAADTQAAVIRQFGLTVGDAGHVADVLTMAVNKSALEMDDLAETMKYVGPVAGRFNQSFEDMAASAAILGNVGIKGSQAGTTIRRALVNMIKPSVRTQNVLKDLGITTKELADSANSADGKLRPLPQILGNLAEHFKDLSAPDRRKALAQLFGVEALPGMVTLFDKGEKVINNMSGSMENANGTARRTAKIMRENVAGAWDEFTGSIETASISLTSRFLPATAKALRAAGDVVDGAIKGARSNVTTTATRRGPQGLASSSTKTAVKEASTAVKVGAQIRKVLQVVGKAAGQAGAMLVDAFKPAMPFFQNVLLPLLKGLGKGILGSVVVAFKVMAVIIKVVATALGFVGRLLRPLRGAFEGIGTVIGFLLGGPILGLLGKLPKVGAVFRLLAVPINFVVGVVGKVAGVFRRVPGILGGAARRAVSAVTGAFGGLLGRMGSIIGKIASGMFSMGKRLVSAIVRGVKAAPGAILDAIKSIIPGPLMDIMEKAGGAVGGLIKKLGGGRDGGIVRNPGVVRRFQEGGLVPIVASGGEMLVDRGRTAMVPGPSDRDATPLLVRPGTAIVTSDGQDRMAMGASLMEAIRTQAPHFKRGGVVAGKYLSTAYGPPWNAMNGTGVTKTGVNLKDAPRAYGVAVDPRMIPLGSRIFAQPNPFGRNGTFKAFDIGGAIKGRRIDFYDWRGRSKQMAWGRREVMVSTKGGGSGDRDPSGASKRQLELRIRRNMDRLDELRERSANITGKGAADRRRPIQSQIRKIVAQNRHLRDQIKDLPKSASGGGGPALTAVDAVRARRMLPDLLKGFSGQAGGFRAGFDIGQAGNRLSQTDIVKEIAAAASIPRRQAAGSVSGTGSRAPSAQGGGGNTSKLRPGGGWGGTENLVMQAIKGLGPATYKRPANHPLSLKNPDSDHNMAHKNAFAADLAPGDSIFNTIRQRLGIPAQKGSWNKFVNRPVKGFRSQLLWHAPDGSHRDHNHLGIRRMRRGGVVGSLPHFQTGGFARGAEPERRLNLRAMAIGDVAETSNQQAVLLMRSLANELDITAGALMRRYNARIKQILRGGVSKAERGNLSRLRASVRELAKVPALAEGITYGALERLRRTVRAQIGTLVKGGLTTGERVTVRRLQGVLTLVETEMGRRVGAMVRTVSEVGTALERSRTRLGQSQRMRGIDESGEQANRELSAFLAASVTVMQGQVKSLTLAKQRASRAGDRETAREIQSMINDLNDNIAEATVAAVEAARAAAEAARQAIVDAATKAADGARTAVDAARTGLSQHFVRHNIDEASSAAQSALGAMLDGQIQQMQATRHQVYEAAVAASNAGDASLTASLWDVWTGLDNDISAMMVEYVQAARAAVLAAAQEAVDSASFGVSQANFGAELIALQQQLVETMGPGAAAAAAASAGLTLDPRAMAGATGGGEQRAQYIQQTVVPALQRQLAAQQAQLAAQQSQGADVGSLRATMEAIGATQTAIMQAHLTATQEVADNTTSLREFSGSTVFEAYGQQFTDVFSVGAGA